MLSVLRTDMPIENPDPAADQDYLKALMVEVATSRDKASFEILFDRFGPRIKGMMEKSGASTDLAEDLVQDVMLTVWRKAALYRPDKGAVSTWIYTVARNARIDRLRRLPAQPYIDVETLMVASEDESPEAEAIGSQQGDLVRSALEKLPSEQRQVVEMAFAEYKPHSEIARDLDLPIGTVKSRLRLAYRKLREELEDLG